ncbi:YvrJ family protein [Geosporobacter ferrireducens]|nr:YvrJ family protein [Geosporobacter ferrireducens]MTI53654.1 YvrJ family protein [Geosporobacter ferrireducens]
MEIFNNFISNLGFPIAVAAFLLIRIEKRLDELNKTLIQVVESLVKAGR